MGKVEVSLGPRIRAGGSGRGGGGHGTAVNSTGKSFQILFKTRVVHT